MLWCNIQHRERVYTLHIIVLVVLVAINGLLAGSEMALVSLRESQVRRLRGRGKRGRVLRRLHADPNRFLSTIQIGITLSGFLASATAAITLAERLAPHLDFLGDYASPELAPKRSAMQRAEGWSLLVARPLSWFASVTWPVVWLLSVTTDAVLRLTGFNPKERRSAISEEEFRDMIAAHKDFRPLERDVISGALEVGDRTLGQIVRQRTSKTPKPVCSSREPKDGSTIRDRYVTMCTGRYGLRTTSRLSLG